MTKADDAPIARSPTTWRGGGRPDYLGLFAVTTGHGLDAIVAEREAVHHDYGAIMAKVLADRSAEAFAERLHERVRRNWWVCARTKRSTTRALIRGRPGHSPARVPRLPGTHREAHHPVGARGEGPRRDPVDRELCHAAHGLGERHVFWHPGAAYFGAGRLGRDQVEDYARRKGWSMAEAEEWLAPNLGYERG